MTTRTDDNSRDRLLRRLVDECYTRVYRFAYRLSGSASDADDVTQQTFLQAQRKLDQLENPERAASWLFSIARNVYLKSLRKPVERDSVSLESVGEPSIDFTGNLIFDGEALQHALDQLPEEYRSTVVLFYFHDLSYKEIAATMDVPLGTVMSRLSRAKSSLRQALGDDDPDSTSGDRARQSTRDEARTAPLAQSVRRESQRLGEES